jgi:hypothetical protein
LCLAFINTQMQALLLLGARSINNVDYRAMWLDMWQ